MSDVQSFTLSSGKVVEMAKMNMLQFIKVQDLVGNISNEAKMAFVLSVASIKSIDGQPVVPLSNQGSFDGVAARFSLEEGFELVQHYGEMHPNPTGDELKNESSAPN